jgi:hypothetical protein
MLMKQWRIQFPTAGGSVARPGVGIVCLKYSYVGGVTPEQTSWKKGYYVFNDVCSIEILVANMH